MHVLSREKPAALSFPFDVYDAYDVSFMSRLALQASCRQFYSNVNSEAASEFLLGLIEVDDWSECTKDYDEILGIS